VTYERAEEMRNLRRLSKEDLISKKKELEFLLMGAIKCVNPVTKIENRKKIKKSIARINTLLKELSDTDKKARVEK